MPSKQLLGSSNCFMLEKDSTTKQEHQIISNNHRNREKKSNSDRNQNYQTQQHNYASKCKNKKNSRSQMF